jgi:hypothetical protein
MYNIYCDEAIHAVHSEISCPYGFAYLLGLDAYLLLEQVYYCRY